MTPLVAKAVFLASSALGVASLGSTAYLVAHPRAFAAPPRVISPEPITAPIAARPLPPRPHRSSGSGSDGTSAGDDHGEQGAAHPAAHPTAGKDDERQGGDESLFRVARHGAE